MRSIRLKKNEQRRLTAGHLWVFSNEIDTKFTPIQSIIPGELVEIENSRGEKIGIAYLNPHSLIAARMLTLDVTTEVDENFFIQRIHNAQKLRDRLFVDPFYRLVYGESDRLPGLIIDRFNQHFVVQITTAGMERLKSHIVSALQNLFKPISVIFRCDSAMRAYEQISNYIEVGLGQPPEEILVPEGQAKFAVNLLESQKTGWYYDQRHNRLNLKPYVSGKTVLDAYCYVGGFGIQAALAGANEVICVDSSRVALEQLKKNAELNQVADRITIIEGDAIEVLKSLKQERSFDVVMLDPPAFIKRKKDFDNGTEAYRRINQLGMHLLDAEGILITSSCSQHCSRDDLKDVIRRASLKAKAQTQILEYGFQAHDHPIHPAIPETEYLKTLFCKISK